MGRSLISLLLDGDFADRIPHETLGRRSFLKLAGMTVPGISGLVACAQGLASEPNTSLRSAPVELGGIWRSSPADAVLRVLVRMRQVSLEGLRLISDRQPGQLYVENHPTGSPAVWLHNDRTDVAWIIVDIGPRDWCKLSYQFGHELGHVLCNSWDARSKPRPPCQWLEESMVEAFSLRGLGLLAASWEMNPPFAGDSGFAAAIRQYRQNVLSNYIRAGGQTSDVEIGSWFRASRSTLESSALSGIEGPLIIRIVNELERDKDCVVDLGALNRWPSRSGIPLEEYLKLWGRSCVEVHGFGRLPMWLGKLLDVT
jgi:hypothetical protein